MDSPLFEPEERTGFHEEEDAMLPIPAMSSLAAPVAPPMYHSAAANAPQPKKRKAGNIDAETAAYFSKIEKSYTTLDPDATVKHDPHSEPLPDLAMFNPSFAAAEKTATEIVCGLRQTVVDSEDKGSEAKFMLERLDCIRTPKYPAPRMICFYGNCAVGKSSLLNACLAVEGLSLKIGDGGVGTLVPIEITHALHTQELPFMARVFWHPRSVCEDIVRAAVADYWSSRLDEDAEATKEAATDLGKPALKILTALFGDKEEFEDEETATQFLSQLKSAKDHKIVDKLLRWTREIITELSTLGNVATITAHTTDQLNAQLEPFIQQCNDPQIEGTSLECSVWPFVKHARKYLANPILSKGVVFVDLPGITDSNNARVNCAHRYLRQCDHVIVVANLDRAMDDSGLEKYALEVTRRKRHGKLTLALTRSDVIDEDECRRLKLSPRQKEHLQSLDCLEQDLKDEVRKTKTLKYSADTPVAYEEFEKKRGLHEYLKKHIQSSRIKIFATARNTHVRTTLQACKVNMEHVRGYPTSEVPRMSVGMTEIPALRSHILSLAAKAGKVEQFQRHCVFICVLLNEMELSCIGSKPMMKRDHLLTILLDVQMNQTHFQTLTTDFKKTFEAPVIAKFNVAMATWLEAAKALCAKWYKYTSPGFTAFLKHQGKWKTPRCGKADWNQELMGSIRQELQPTFDAFRGEGCSAFRTEAILLVNELLENLEEKMKNDLDISQSVAFRPFFASFRDRRQEMTHIVNEVVDNMDAALLAINNDAFNVGQSSTFTRKMLKIYEKADAERPRKGGAIHIAKKARFSALVCDRTEGSYPEVKKYVDYALAKTINSVEKNLADRCAGVLKSILGDFNRVCPESEDRSVLTLQRREILGRKVKESKQRMEEELRGHLTQCGVALD
ncbi:hypothetical protein SLS60_010341 [Paraconiothyrium brasiliense]|uniref:Uncharacterized protein n=1 Tax=Paraconiothyrium brasiliense TaxID=300254 RepID=A0ABR3QR03_9PLEO